MYTLRDFNLLVLLVLFPSLFQTLLTLALYMVADNDIVMASPREDFSSLNTIVSQC